MWKTIDSAPKDGTLFIGLKDKHVAPTKIGKYYVKWPNEIGGPTFREEWNEIEKGRIVP